MDFSDSPKEAAFRAEAKAWLAGQARHHYDAAEANGTRCGRRLWPGLAMLRLYRRLFDRLPREERPRLRTLEALVIVLACRLGLPR